MEVKQYLEVTGSTCAELAAFYTYNIFEVVYPFQEIQVECMTNYHLSAGQIEARSHSSLVNDPVTDSFSVQAGFHYSLYSVDVFFVCISVEYQRNY